MKRFLVMLLSLFAQLVILSFSYGSEYKQGEVLVKFHPNAHVDQKGMSQLYQSLGVMKIRRFQGDLNSGNRFEQWYLDPNFTVEEVLIQLRQFDFISYAQPNYLLKIGKNEGLVDSNSSKPNLIRSQVERHIPVEDPYLTQVWGLEKIHAIEGWNQQRGGQ